MATRIGINGFGRIGRLVLRSILEREPDAYEVVGINDLVDAPTLSNLFKHDTAHGSYDGTVTVDGQTLTVDGEEIEVFAEKDPTQLPWGDLNTDVVVESTGIFRTRDKAAQHLKAGADKVIISAPAKSEVDATVVLGVNDDQLTGDEEVVSNASCTTNCLAPMAKILDDSFGLDQGFMTTVHAYTSSQQIQDGPHSDWRRARAAAENIVPTTTGAAKAVGLVLPELDGKLDGMAMRVPVLDGSITDLTAMVDQEVTKEDVDRAFEAAANGPMDGIVQYTDEMFVSSDIVHNPHSCVYQPDSTKADGRMVKLIAWYDNEWGYASRTAELARLLVEKSG